MVTDSCECMESIALLMKGFHYCIALIGQRPHSYIWKKGDSFMKQNQFLHIKGSDICECSLLVKERKKS